MDTLIEFAEFTPNSDRWSALPQCLFRRDNGDVYRGFLMVDEAGAPVLDEEGNQQFVPHDCAVAGPERQAREVAARTALDAQQAEDARLEELRARHLRYKADPVANAADKLTSEELADLVVSLLG
jgi:hypothetical protein